MRNNEIPSAYLIRALARSEGVDVCTACGARMFVPAPTGQCVFCLHDRPVRATAPRTPVPEDWPFAPRLRKRAARRHGVRRWIRHILNARSDDTLPPRTTTAERLPGPTAPSELPS